MQTSKKTIIDYYDTCESDYRFFWDLDHSHAMHAGYWDETTKTLRQALKRQNEVLARMVDIQASDKVLDAGCGIGGSSLYLSQEIGCQTVGITLSDRQVQTATRLAEKYQLSDKCSFQTMDFSNMSFPDQTFDVVWAIESFCHAPCKQTVVHEAFRVLKKGGRLIIADGFQLKPQTTGQESRQMETWLQGWGCERLDSTETFHSFLKKAGFDQTLFTDITAHVLPSSKKLYYISFPAWLFSKVGEWLRLRQPMQTNNISAAYAQYMTLKQHLWHYGIFTAVKKED
jgi:cyclopropane fatty-acyl-phospholipid synthase-like methyltransferase